MTSTVFVAGATGRLGWPLARHLTQGGHRVRTVSRTPDSPIAKDLEGQGVEVAPGDFDDPTSLRAAVRGADAVFAMSTPHGAGIEAEIRHGVNLVDAAVEAEVEYVVYSSGASADRDTGVPFYDSKHRVEQHLSRSGCPHTIIGPAFYMENVFNPWNQPALRAGRYPTPIPVDHRMQQIPVLDVAAFAAVVLQRPDDFVGQRLDIASDELSATEAAAALTRVTGQEVEPEQTSHDQLPPPLVALAAWHEREGYDVDVDLLRRRYPEVAWHSFEEWAKTQDWTVLGSG